MKTTYYARKHTSTTRKYSAWEEGTTAKYSKYARSKKTSTHKGESNSSSNHQRNKSQKNITIKGSPLRRSFFVNSVITLTQDHPSALALNEYLRNKLETAHCTGGHLECRITGTLC